MNIMKFILARLQEPSTWSALAVLGTLAGLPPGSLDLVHQIVVGVIGLGGVILSERAKP